MLSAKLCGLIMGVTATVRDAQRLIQELVEAQAVAYNVSYSAAAMLHDGSVMAAAAGFDDHATGSKVTIESMYPSGSVTKTFTAVGIMRLAQQGKLDLDATAASLIDPWMKAHGRLSLKMQWDGDDTIETVTVRQLLQMRSGIADYDDSSVRAWTLEHPSEDYTPELYLRNVSKEFLFRPGTGGAYTGVGYVLLGWVLCAVKGGCASNFADLDQRSLVETETFALGSRTRFMKRGPCSQYSGVVHQYEYAPLGAAHRAFRSVASLRESLSDHLRRDDSAFGMPGARTTRPQSSAALYDGVWMRHSNAVADEEAPMPRHCTVHKTGQKGDWWPGIVFSGPSIGRRSVSSGGAEGCCALSDEVAGSAFWTFAPSGDVATPGSGEGGGVCTFFPYTHVRPSMRLDATSGRSDPRIRLSDFRDVIHDSCLNGWTMGNIATTPQDMVHFYHALFVRGTLLSPTWLKQMTQWQKLTTGFAPGSSYGLGLFAGELVLPLKGVYRCNGLPACKCALFRGCALHAHTVGHPGLDYGSGMPLMAFVTELNISYAVAVNAGESPMGMNSSLSLFENFRVLDQLYCRFIDIIVHAQLPSYPPLECKS